MNRVYIKTYGCQMNERDSEAVAALLRNRGYSIVGSETEADVVLLNTCSVRDQAEQKAIGKAASLQRMRANNPNLVVGIMGCMAQNRGSDLIDRLPDIDLIVGTQKFHRVPEYLDNRIDSLKGQGPRPSTIVDTDEENDSHNTIRLHDPQQRQVSAFVSIMQGCNMNCAFCIVPKTRGPERCRPIEAVVEEVEELAANGTREVTLLGQIVNRYGTGAIPFKNGVSPFVQLLQAVSTVDGIERIRFISPHPCGFKRDLIEAYRDLPKLCEYVHLPLQSGSNRILRAMKRPYTRERYQALVEQLRAVVPDMYFSTDIIVGFPGESDEDFEQTRKCFDAHRFDMAFIFKYSTRSGTPAACMPQQIPQALKEERNEQLLEILRAHSLRRNRSLIGSVQEVLVEGPARKGKGLYMGRTRGYRKVIFPASECLIGKLASVRIDEAAVSTLSGALVLKG